MSSCLYTVLRVTRSASASDIKAGWRKLVLETHPDQGGSEEAFKVVSDAWSILGDPDKRSQYDIESGFRPTATATASNTTSGPIHAPMYPPSGGSGKVYDFKAWQDHHYGATPGRENGFVRRNESKLDRATFQHSASQRTREKVDIVARMHARRELRRKGDVQGGRGGESGGCTVQ